MFTLYIYCIGFHADTKSYPVYHEHLSVVTLHLRDDAHSAALLCHRNHAEIIVLLCEQKANPVFQVFMPAQKLCSIVHLPTEATLYVHKTQVTGHKCRIN